MTNGGISPAIIALLAWQVLPAKAGSAFTDLSASERLILGNEIREVLLGVPEILPDRQSGYAPSYEDEIASDLALIRSHEKTLFSADREGFGTAAADRVIALFVAQGCTDCARAETELRALARRHDIRVTLFDMDRNENLAAALGLDTAPSYILSDMMLRGHIPTVVLERYLSR